MSEALSCVDNTCPKEFLWKVLKQIIIRIILVPISITQYSTYIESVNKPPILLKAVVYKPTKIQKKFFYF